VWDEIAKHLPEFPTAVLNVLDVEGYPYSVRCRPVPERSAGLLRLDLATDAAIQPGRASLLCHSHDELLWNQKVFLVRGRLVRDEDGWALGPEHVVPGADSPLSLARFVIGVRRNAAAYLRKHGLARPPIPWDEIDAVKEQARRS
jgi:hypothetical protein